MNNLDSKLYEVPRDVLMGTLDALDDNCNFFACEGSFFPPLHMKTCRNCYSSWRLKMVMCGYSQKEMEYITDLHEKEYWRLWNRMYNCEHTDAYYEEEEPSCSKCGKVFGEDETITTGKIIVREQKAIHNAIDLIITLQERRDIDCGEIKKILYS